MKTYAPAADSTRRRVKAAARARADIGKQVLDYYNARDGKAVPSEYASIITEHLRNPACTTRQAYKVAEAMHQSAD